MAERCSSQPHAHPDITLKSQGLTFYPRRCGILNTEVNELCGYSNRTNVCAYGQLVRDHGYIALRIQNTAICKYGESDALSLEWWWVAQQGLGVGGIGGH